MDPTISISVRDISEPRKVNAQSIILRETAEGYDVLLQLRSMSMKCMPGHLSALGGCRDRTDKDSRETALREVKEECGLITTCVSKGPSKFAEGEKCDWFVMVLNAKPAFEAKAKSRSECGDMKSVASLLPSSKQLAECYGHVWLPTNEMQNIDPKLPLMGGVERKNWVFVFLQFAALCCIQISFGGSETMRMFVSNFFLQFDFNLEPQGW